MLQDLRFPLSSPSSRWSLCGFNIRSFAFDSSPAFLLVLNFLRHKDYICHPYHFCILYRSFAIARSFSLAFSAHIRFRILVRFWLPESHVDSAGIHDSSNYISDLGLYKIIVNTNLSRAEEKGRERDGNIDLKRRIGISRATARWIFRWRMRNEAAGFISRKSIRDGSLYTYGKDQRRSVVFFFSSFYSRYFVNRMTQNFREGEKKGKIISWKNDSTRACLRIYCVCTSGASRRYRV